MGRQHGLPLTKADLAVATAKCPVCQHQRPTQRPWYGTVLQGDQIVTWWQIGYIGPLPPRKEQSFVLTRMLTLVIDMPFLPTMLCQNYHLWTYRGPYPPLGYPTRQQLWLEIHFTANEVRQLAPTHGIHWSEHIPHYLEGAGLRELWKGHFTMWVRRRSGKQKIPGAPLRTTMSCD